MFDTERLIIEIGNRECIWNTGCATYSDRIVKKRAWEEVAAICYNNWETYTFAERQETGK